jgi:hypothetical protein
MAKIKGERKNEKHHTVGTVLKACRKKQNIYPNIQIHAYDC